MPTLVADASALVEWLVAQPNSPTLRAAFEGADVAAPTHVDAEVLNALRGLVRRGTVREPRARLALRQLRAADIERMSIPPLLERAWALRDNLTAYDALYVALAQELACPLLTADRRLGGAPGLGIAMMVIDA